MIFSSCFSSCKKTFSVCFHFLGKIKVKLSKLLNTQRANECIPLSWNCKENSSLPGLLSHIVIAFIMIAGWISNSRHLLSCYFHSSILSPLWTLLGHSRAWAASSTQFFLAVWCCGESQHLWIKTSWILVQFNVRWTQTHMNQMSRFYKYDSKLFQATMKYL